MKANELEGAYVLDAALVVVADATGAVGHPVDLLRVDPQRVREALQGRASVAFSYAVGEHAIATGYFPIAGGPGGVERVLALEAGQAFVGARAALARATWIGVALSALGALTLAAVALRWARSEGQRRREAERAARGDALARMGAMVAHEIRNPLGVIRGAVELVSARGGAALPERDRGALGDVLGEVERLHRITEDFLDLAREPRMSRRRWTSPGSPPTRRGPSRPPTRRCAWRSRSRRSPCRRTPCGSARSSRTCSSTRPRRAPAR
jgi:signal transduction histidine kinase